MVSLWFTAINATSDATKIRKTIRKLAISSSLYFNNRWGHNYVLLRVHSILSQNQLFSFASFSATKNNRICKCRQHKHFRFINFRIFFSILICFPQRFLTILNRNASNLINRSHCHLVNFSRSLPHISLPRFLTR